MLDKCKARTEARVLREKKKVEEEAQKVRNAEDHPVEAFIRELYKDGMASVNIIARLNREYPPPEGKDKWDLISVVDLYSTQLNWPMGPCLGPFSEPLSHDHVVPLVAREGEKAGQVVCRRCIRDLWGDEDG